jgi:DNA-binding transcriptional LysR family regulator
MAVPPNIPPPLLRSFVAVSELKSFTAAARRLNLRQSTVSQHIQKLEALTGRRLLLRDTHGVMLTTEGGALREFARGILDANGRLERFLAGSAARETLRLGISEDFAVAQLADVLTAFRADYPDVDLELTVGLSAFLYQRYDAGEIDLIFAKRRRGDRRGDVAWREPLAWIARPGFTLPKDAPVPLVSYSPPSITRSLAIGALESVGRSWRMVCTSGSLNGLRAGIAAGLGIAAHSARLMPAGLVELAPPHDLPALGEVEFVAIGPGHQHAAANALIDALTGGRG